MIMISLFMIDYQKINEVINKIFEDILLFSFFSIFFIFSKKKIYIFMKKKKIGLIFQGWFW